jgi:UDP-N-acetylmuramoyl-tripeptide--D-alanyl-D-alanine ligase
MIRELYQIYKEHSSICTDTRTITKGALFFALKGENFDGNDYAEKALYDGCAYAVVDNPLAVKNKQYILVEDVLTTLQDLAKHHRSQLNIPFIGITGSNGKTTTKELINEVLKKKYRTQATKGNLNNHIGVPLTVLSVSEDTEIAIIEMGANHQREIDFLCNIAKPDYGIITNIGKAHMEGFGGVEGIKKGKGELFDYIRNNGGKLFLNADSEVILELAANAPAITYGSFEDCYTQGTFIGADPYVTLEWQCKTKEIKSNLLASSIIGKYNYSNILAAICIGNFFDVNPVLINEAIKNYIPSNNRSQILETGKNTLLLDAYNANPTSMEAAIKNFQEMKADRKIVILGDMLELGQETKSEHQNIANLIDSNMISQVYLVGPHFMDTDCGFKKFLSSNDLKLHLSDQQIAGATILIKGSRGMKLENVTEVL